MEYLIGFIGGGGIVWVIMSFNQLSKNVIAHFEDKEDSIVKEISAEEKLADRLIESMQTSPEDWSIFHSFLIRNSSMKWELRFNEYRIEFNGIEVFSRQDEIRLYDACKEFTKQKTMTNI